MLRGMLKGLSAFCGSWRPVGSSPWQCRIQGLGPIEQRVFVFLSLLIFSISIHFWIHCRFWQHRNPEMPGISGVSVLLGLIKLEVAFQRTVLGKKSGTRWVAIKYQPQTSRKLINRRLCSGKRQDLLSSYSEQRKETLWKHLDWVWTLVARE